jgi:TRAP-type C4-dicarboxylate transport system substrate-binding protein
MSVYQPVDLMDLTVNMRTWTQLPDPMKQLVEDQVHAYSLHHYVTIQKRNVEALEKFKQAGSTVSRLSAQDMQEFRRAAIPVWYRWANKNDDAKEIFKLQLEFMMNDIVGYITPDDIKGQSL